MDGLADRRTQVPGSGCAGGSGPAARPDGELARGLARAEEQVSRLVIAREEVTRVLAGNGAEAPEEQDGAPAWTPRPGSPVGLVTVPEWREGTEASVLPQVYRDLVEVVADAGRPLRAAQVAAAAGLATDRGKVEALRSRLKRLSGRGWLAELAGPSRTNQGHYALGA